MGPTAVVRRHTARLPASLSIVFLVSATSACWAAEFKVATAEYTSQHIPLMKRLFEEARIPAQFSTYPAERSRQLLIHGDVDAEFYRQPSAIKEIASQVKLVGPLACVEVVAFVRANSNVDIASLEDLKKYRIGAPLGNRLPMEIASAARADAEIANDTALMRMLAAGRIDVVIETQRIGTANLQKLNLQEVIVRRGPVLTSPPSYLVLRNHLKEFAPQLQDAANRLISTGEWRKGYSATNKRLGLPPEAGISCLTKN